MDRLRFHPPGRRCELASCITVLNHFNPGPFCLLHQEQVDGMPLLEFRDVGMSRLWVALMLTRRGLRGSAASRVPIE